MLRRVCFAIAFAIAAFAQTPRPSFEVASGKPAIQPQSPLARVFGTMPLSLKTRDPGRLKITSRSLRDIVAAAYMVQPLQVSGPAWMGDALFDIEAKIPENQTSQTAEMMQVLLEERFGLKLHRESRTVPGYELVVAKGGPKLTPPDPLPDYSAMEPEERKKRLEEQVKQAQRRQMANPHAGSGSSWGGPMTIPELAVRLANQLGDPVADLTGIEGKYQVTIATSSGNPDEPDVTVFDAVAKLGLKLESRKISVETLVIDEVSKVPTEN